MMRRAVRIQVIASLFLLASSGVFAAETNVVSEKDRPISATLLSVLENWSRADAAAIASSYEPHYRASFNLAVARQSGWQRITRHWDHAADDCRLQALGFGLIVAERQ